MTRDELDATVVERAKRRYSGALSGEEQVVLSRAAHALRVKGMLVEALKAEESCECNAPESRFSAYPCAACRTRRRAALAEARKTP